jgi:tRNA threonylcarbamoyladenosine modification (KEOPS) complex Cgi121 subunit
LYEIQYLVSETILPVQDIVEYARGLKNFFQLIDVSALISEEQLIFATERLERIRNLARIRSKPLLLLCLVSGEHQIKNAITKAGIRPDTRSAVCLYESKNTMIDFLRMFDCFKVSKDPLLPSTSPERDAELFGKMVSSQLRLVS